MVLLCSAHGSIDAGLYSRKANVGCSRDLLQPIWFLAPLFANRMPKFHVFEPETIAKTAITHFSEFAPAILLICCHRIKLMSDYLPRDLLPDILARLAAEDLVRCTAVCKKWYVLIRSPSFISMHLKQSREDKDRNCLLFRIPNPSGDNYYLCAEDTFHEPKKFTIPHALFRSCFRIVGNCNGLVCLINYCPSYDIHMTFKIWNPVIRRAKIVPRPNVSLPSYEFVWHAVGFGYDSVTNDHKIIKITFLMPDLLPLVQVYSLNTGVWTDLASDRAPATHEIFYGFHNAYVHGAVHWLAVGKHNNCFLISAFDMKDEMIREMQIPESLRFLLLSGQELLFHVYQESISLIHIYGFKNANPGCDIWLMREYGVEESWTRLVKIDFEAFSLGSALSRNVIGMRSNGEVFITSQEGKLLSYDCKNDLVSDLKITGGKDIYVFDVYMGAYTESLVLLDELEDLYDMTSRRELARMQPGRKGIRVDCQ